MTTKTKSPSVVLRNHQAEAYETLAFELGRLDGTPSYRMRSRLNKIDRAGVALYRHCKQLEVALNAEDERLRRDGTTPELDARWIKNLRRLELMRALLNRAKAAIAAEQAVAA